MNHYDVYFALRVLMPRVNNEHVDQPVGMHSTSIYSNGYP